MIEDKVLEERNEKERMRKKVHDYLSSPDYHQRLMQRLKINDVCNDNKEARDLIWQQCARPDNPAEGCIFFIETFGFTFDPRSEPKHFPFILFDFQGEAVRWMIDHVDNGTDGFIEKSRDMGMTWIDFVWIPVWYWIFRDGINLLLGSYKEELVDSKTDDSLFGRIDYAIDSLPHWLLPRGFKKSKHRTHMKLVNPSNYNLLSGDTMNPDFGRGARKTAVLFDELGSWDYAKDAWDSCADTTPCRIANSTPKGHNFFSVLRETGIDKLTLHWTRHPLKDQQWYEFEKTRRAPEVIAQELDISYTKSQEGVVYSEWNETNVIHGMFDYDPNLPLFIGWDFGGTDDTAIIWTQPYRGKLRIVDTYRNTGKIIDFYIPLINGVAPSGKYIYTREEQEMIDEHRYWKPAMHFGDPAGRFTHQAAERSVIDQLKTYNINVNFRDEWKEWNIRKNAAKRRILDGIELNTNERTKYFNVCILNAAYPKVKNQGLEEIRSLKPKHDNTSHYRSAFEYLSLGLEQMSSQKPKSFDKFPRKDMSMVRRKNRVIGY